MEILILKVCLVGGDWLNNLSNKFTNKRRIFLKMYLKAVVTTS